MSNIHGLSDLPFPSSASVTLSSRSSPRFLDLVFPSFKLVSFITIISFIELIVYLVTVIVFEPSGQARLSPSWWTLNTFGGTPRYIARGHIYYLVTEIFLHVTIWHLLSNIFSQLCLGCAIEARLGAFRMAVLYFASGIMGNITGAAFQCVGGVGASSAGFGIIGVLVTDIALNWHVIDDKPQQIFRIILFVVMLTVPSIFARVDHLAHLGGFVTGAAIDVLYSRSMENKPRWFNYASWGSMIFLPFWIAMTCALTFTLSRNCPF